MLPSADAATLARVRAVMVQADRRSVDPVLALNNAGLLDSARRRRQVMADTLRQTADMLAQVSVRQLAGGGRMPHTALDTQRLIEGWLRGQAAELEAADA
jgi:hypothetical protein